MYSWEIDTLMQIRNYLLDVEEYCKVCDTSPQISRVKYEPFENSFNIWTTDGYYWKFYLKTFEESTKEKRL